LRPPQKAEKIKTKMDIAVVDAGAISKAFIEWMTPSWGALIFDKESQNIADV